MRKLAAFLSLGLCSSPALAQQVDIPLNNWTVPPYTRTSGGITTMTDIAGPRVFVPMQPCRVVDTRGGGPFTGAYGPPAMVANATRSFDINSAPHCPGVSVTATAYSLNFTVTQTAGAPGDIRVWPTGNPPVQITSVLNWTSGNATVANATIMPAGTGGSIDVNVAGTDTHLLIDINGYFSDNFANSENPLIINNNSSQYSIVTSNGSTTCTGACGIRANIISSAGAHALSGYALGPTGTNYGVYGETSGVGLYTSGVFGLASLTGAHLTVGVSGQTNSSDPNGAGVFGHAIVASASAGRFLNDGLAGADLHLGTRVSGTDYAIYTFGKILGGSLEITGMSKNFVAPHPEDPGMEIRYASVEAPTVDVYFRGTATLVNGIARIEVPDHFRWTARDGTYMTELTPMGRAVALSVDQEGPEGIVVRGPGNTRFHYVVYAERAEIVGYEPVAKNTNFTPEALEKGGGPQTLSEPTRALLIRNGTLNPDGTYNVETARAQGWTIPDRAAEAARLP